MRRKSERNKSKTSPEKKTESPKKPRRHSRRRKRSTSHSGSDSDEAPLKVAVVPAPVEPTPPAEPPKKSSNSNSEEENSEQPVWKVKTAESASTGEIQKLKICLTRPPSTPERTEKSPRRRRHKSSNREENEDKGSKRRTRRNSPSHSAEDTSSQDNSYSQSESMEQDKDECLIIVKETNEAIIGEGKLEQQDSENENDLVKHSQKVSSEIIDQQPQTDEIIQGNVESPKNSPDQAEIAEMNAAIQSLQQLNEAQQDYHEIEPNQTSPENTDKNIQNLAPKENIQQEIDDKMDVNPVENSEKTSDEKVVISEQKDDKSMGDNIIQPIENIESKKSTVIEAKLSEAVDTKMEISSESDQTEVKPQNTESINKSTDETEVEKKDVTDEQLVSDKNPSESNKQLEKNIDTSNKSIDSTQSENNKELVDSAKEEIKPIESEDTEKKCVDLKGHDSKPTEEQEKCSEKLENIEKSDKTNEISEEKEKVNEEKVNVSSDQDANQKVNKHEESVKETVKLKEEIKKAETCAIEESKEEIKVEKSNEEIVKEVVETKEEIKVEEKDKEQENTTDKESEENVNKLEDKVTEAVKKTNENDNTHQKTEQKDNTEVKTIISSNKTVDNDNKSPKPDKIEAKPISKPEKDNDNPQDSKIEENTPAKRQRRNSSNEEQSSSQWEEKMHDSSFDNSILYPSYKSPSGSPVSIEKDSEPLRRKKKPSWDRTVHSKTLECDIITSDTIIKLLPHTKMLSMEEVKLEEEIKEEVKEEKKPQKHVEKVEESPRTVIKPILSPVELPEKEVFNIGLNRKISIVNDEASKLQPPPSPAKNPISAVLFITNLVRPFTLKQLQELLSRTGNIKEDGFWTDRIKSKCYVQYESEEEAEATRNALHGVQWPIGNGKKLIIDFGTMEAMEAARNPIIVETPKPIPEKILEKENIPEVDRKKETNERVEKEVRKASVREWDLGKVAQEEREERKHSRDGDREDRSRHRDRSRNDRSRDRNDKRRHSSPSNGEHAIERKQKKVEEEEVPAKLMDDLFRKTKATPSIYWLPLSPEQIAQKQQERLERMAEHKRRLEETRRGGGVRGGGEGPRRPHRR